MRDQTGEEEEADMEVMFLKQLNRGWESLRGQRCQSSVGTGL